MKLFILALLIILVYLCIYSIVDRICKCVENTQMAKAYGMYLSAGVNVKSDTFSECVKKAIADIRKTQQDKTNDQKDN